MNTSQLRGIACSHTHAQPGVAAFERWHGEGLPKNLNDRYAICEHFALDVYKQDWFGVVGSPESVAAPICPYDASVLVSALTCCDVDSTALADRIGDSRFG